MELALAGEALCIMAMNMAAMVFWHCKHTKVNNDGIHDSLSNAIGM